LVRIQVTAFKGKPLPRALVGEFNELGGTIGRAEGNTLVLPDPGRHISRTHAVIAVRAGGYVIRDQGSAVPVEINGQQLGNGQEAPIAQGDKLRIGDYSLKIDILADTATTPSYIKDIAGSDKGDSVTPIGGGVAQVDDPFADLALSQPARASAAPSSSNRNAVTPDSRGVTPPAGVIPDDFDPFADLEPQASDSARLPDDFHLNPENPEAQQRIDDVFDLNAPVGHDPLDSRNPLAEPLREPTEQPDTDPLVAFGARREPRPEFQPAQRDDAPELHSPFRPPQFRPDDQGQQRGTLHGKTAAEPKAPIESTSMQEAPSAAATPNLKQPTPERKKTAAHALTADAELLRAFLRGTGVPGLELPSGLTPELMQLLGQLLREATQGTLDLLLARALIKRELRATVTMIVAKENNPLKFSPTVEAALMHLLQPQEHGFMTAQRAMRDAYDDLRSHQFGFMAGMRAALEGVLQKFDPAQLERRLTQSSVLDSLLPMNRKARLWDLFAELYGEISKEAEDDFHNLFGREFLRAYHAQIEKLRSKNRDPSG